MADISTGSAGYVQFENDDKGYSEWLAANPNGFVVNSHRLPKPSYLILHRSSCKFINSPDRSNWTTTGYIKTCSENIEPLSDWARNEIGGDLQPCGLCKPGLDRRPTTGPERPTATARPKPAVELAPVQQPALGRPQSSRRIPEQISTGCPELDLVWKTFAADILGRPHVLIADTEDDLNWHAFLGHSIDMQGFRAAEFIGVDPLTKHAPGFIPLKQRGIGIRELAELWEVPEIREHLLNKSSGTPLQSSLDVLKAAGGANGRSLVDAFDAFPYRKGHWTVRAYLQNCAAMKEHGYSFRNWLKAECAKLGVSAFPPTDFRAVTGFKSMTVETALRHRLEQTFYQVGPALAAYMLCDWQLWLWREGRTAVFANFKLDSFHEEFVKRFGRGVIPSDEQGFAQWWLSLYPGLPPRLANECIWLGLEHKVV